MSTKKKTTKTTKPAKKPAKNPARKIKPAEARKIARQHALPGMNAGVDREHGEVLEELVTQAYELTRRWQKAGVDKDRVRERLMKYMHEHKISTYTTEEQITATVKQASEKLSLTAKERVVEVDSEDDGG